VRLEPLQLSAQQEAVLRLDALQRILDDEATPAHHLRASVLTALATRHGPCLPTDRNLSPGPATQKPCCGCACLVLPGIRMGLFQPRLQYV
jgi:hypothetical protein